MSSLISKALSSKKPKIVRRDNDDNHNESHKNIASLDDDDNDADADADDDDKKKQNYDEIDYEDEAEQADDADNDDEDDDDADDVDDDDDEDDEYLQKFSDETKENIIDEYYPEMLQQNHDEVIAMSNIIRNEKGVIIDKLHKTTPVLTKFEKARILGERARQLEQGATPFVQITPDDIDSYLIACKELEEKVVPFIIKRPLPNGGCEYWKLKDLEFLQFL
jgi:DNA-directed RNA polymerase I, II, and III subunit RPABC2